MFKTLKKIGSLSSFQIQLFVAEFFIQVGQASQKQWRAYQSSQQHIKILDDVLESTLSQSKKTAHSLDLFIESNRPEGYQILKQLILITADRLSAIKEVMLSFIIKASFDLFQQMLVDSYKQYLLIQNPNYYQITTTQTLKIHLLKKKDFDLRQFVNVMILLGISNKYAKLLKTFFFKFQKDGLLCFKSFYSLFVCEEIDLTFSVVKRESNFTDLMQAYLDLQQQQLLIKHCLSSLGVEALTKIYQYLDVNNNNSVGHKQVYKKLELNEVKPADIEYSLISLFGWKGTNVVSMRKFIFQIMLNN